MLIFFVGFVDWFRAFYLYCSPYNFWLLKAIAQSKVNLSVSLLSAKKSENYRKRHGRNKQRTHTKKIKSDNFPRSNREMSNIANVILEKRTI